MREAIVILLVGALLLVPLTASDDSDAVNRYDVVFFDLTGHETASCEVKEGDTIADAAPYIWNQYPYWYDLDTGYKWEADAPVTCDLHLHASETEPPAKPAEVNVLPYVGIALALVAAVVIGWFTSRRPRTHPF